MQWNNGSFAGASNSVVTAGGAVTLGLSSNTGVTTTALTVNGSSSNIVDFYSSNEGFVVASMLTNGVLDAQGVVINNTINFGTAALKVTGGSTGSPDIVQFWGQTGSPEGNVRVVWVDFNGNLNVNGESTFIDTAAAATGFAALSVQGNAQSDNIQDWYITGSSLGSPDVFLDTNAVLNWASDAGITIGGNLTITNVGDNFIINVMVIRCST